MGRLLRGTFKLTVVIAAIGAGVVVARKLMGGLGPEPGSADAPGEWPSLVPDPEPAAPGPADPAASNGTRGAGGGAPAVPAPEAADGPTGLIDEVPGAAEEPTPES